MPKPRKQYAVSKNTERPFEEFWENVQRCIALPFCPKQVRDTFQALLLGKTLGFDQQGVDVFWGILTDIEGWSPEEGLEDPLACPVFFGEILKKETSAEKTDKPKGRALRQRITGDKAKPRKGEPPLDLPAAPERTALVRDLEDDEVFSMPLSGEAYGFCVPGSLGLFGWGAPPGLPIEEIKARLLRMKGLIDEVSLVLHPLETFPDGAFFAMLLPGAKEGSQSWGDYFIFQMLSKDGRDPEPPPRPWEC